MKLSLWAALHLLLFSLPVMAFADQTVIVGDSMTCGPFGQSLFKKLVAEEKRDVTLYCAVSSAPEHWLKGKKPSGQICQTMSTASPKLSPCGGSGAVPTFERILERHPNAKVIVALGTNSLGSPKASAAYSEMAKLASAKGQDCKWVGPPHLNPRQAKGFSSSRLNEMDKNLGSFYSSLSQGVGDNGCKLINSLEATKQGTPGHQTNDGVHRTKEAGQYWVNQIMDDLRGAPAVDRKSNDSSQKSVN